MHELFLPRPSRVSRGSAQLVGRSDPLSTMRCSCTRQPKSALRGCVIGNSGVGGTMKPMTSWSGPRTMMTVSREGRSLPRHEAWLKTLRCPVLRLAVRFRSRLWSMRSWPRQQRRNASKMSGETQDECMSAWDRLRQCHLPCRPQWRGHAVRSIRRSLPARKPERVGHKRVVTTDGFAFLRGRHDHHRQCRRDASVSGMARRAQRIGRDDGSAGSRMRTGQAGSRR